MYTEDPAWPSNQHVCSKFFVDTDGFVEEMVSYDGSNWHYAAPPKQPDFKIELVPEAVTFNEPAKLDNLDEVFDSIFSSVNKKLKIKSSESIKSQVNKELEARVFKYLSNNGTRTIKQIQSSLNRSVYNGVTCAELYKLMFDSRKFRLYDTFQGSISTTFCLCN